MGMDWGEGGGGTVKPGNFGQNDPFLRFFRNNSLPKTNLKKVKKQLF